MAQLKKTGRGRVNPALKDAVTGQDKKSTGRKSGKVAKTKPIGEPYDDMTEEACEIWHRTVDEIPWLDSSHRMLLRQLCILHVRDSVVGLSAGQLTTYVKILQLMGATPVDASKLTLSDDQTEDPLDKFFSSRKAANE